MKRFRSFAMAMVMGVMLASTALAADGPAVTGFASLDAMSNYVWRGQKIGNSWVLQPSLGITYEGFSAAFWANYDSDRVEMTSGNESGHGEVNEVDFTLSYSRTIGKFTVGAGYIYYAFDGANDTQEVFATATANVLLNPTLTVYYDFDEGDGWYIVAGISHTFSLPKDISLKLAGYASYNIDSKMLGYDEEGGRFSNFYNAEVSSALTIPVTKNFSITPKVAYTWALSNDAKHAIRGLSDDGRRDLVYGGVNLTFSF